MEYLSFDIECCDGRHICEFGYVTFDESFSVVEKDCILMDPEHPFCLTGREKEPDLVLAFPEEAYYAAPSFPTFYSKIKALLEAEDRTILGFSLKNDCEFLATAWDLYGLAPARFTYYDMQRFFRDYAKLGFSPSLERMVEELGVPQEEFTFHRSVDDALAVMRCLQKIAENEGLSVGETLSLLGKRSNLKKPFSSAAHSRSLTKKLLEGDEAEQEDFLKRFLPRVTPGSPREHALFTGKAVAISLSLQKERFNDFLTLAANVLDVGATYTEDGAQCDVFIGYVGTEADPRLGEALQARERGKEILLLPLRAALRELSLMESDLAKPDYAHAGNAGKEKPDGSFVAQTTAPTLADLFRAKGNDLRRK